MTRMMITATLMMMMMMMIVGLTIVSGFTPTPLSSLSVMRMSITTTKTTTNTRSTTQLYHSNDDDHHHRSIHHSQMINDDHHVTTNNNNNHIHTIYFMIRHTLEVAAFGMTVMLTTIPTISIATAAVTTTTTTPSFSTTATTTTTLVLSDTSNGASSAANAKLTTGGASTLQSGRTISITRGVNLDNSNFANQNLKGVAFQQSVVRDTDFSNSNLVGASFFDATVDGSNFNNADMTMSNIEMAQFNRATMKNTIARDMYVSGATLLEGILDIEGSDWTDTYLRADQQKYLCAHPTAKGNNPITGVSTRESLQCKD